MAAQPSIGNWVTPEPLLRWPPMQTCPYMPMGGVPLSMRLGRFAGSWSKSLVVLVVPSRCATLVCFTLSAGFSSSLFPKQRLYT